MSTSKQQAIIDAIKKPVKVVKKKRKKKSKMYFGMPVQEAIIRYNESSNSWLTTWTEGSGLPNNAGERFYDIWTDGTELVVGGAEFTNWGGFRTGTIS